jgi:pimeloyl-ACP methyl ester carboxylesterase
MHWRLIAVAFRLLRVDWRRLYHREPPRISRDLFVLGLGYRLQEIAYGIRSTFVNGSPALWRLAGPVMRLPRISASPWPLDFSRAVTVDAKRIGCPVYIVSGGEDRLIPASLVRKVARLYPQAIQRDYPTRGHLVIDDEDTDEMVRSICGWLAVEHHRQSDKSFLVPSSD